MNESFNPAAENGPIQPEQGHCEPLADGMNVEQLHRRVQELEAENKRCREELATVQAEPDHWRTEAFHWVQKEFDRQGMLTDEEWQRLIEEEKWYPMEDLVDELNELAKEI